MAILFGTPDAQMLEKRNWRQTILKPPRSCRPTPSKAPSASWRILWSIPRLVPGASEELPHADRIDLQLRCRTALLSMALARECGRTIARLDNTPNR
jgi:hypothetical protein